MAFASPSWLGAAALVLAVATLLACPAHARKTGAPRPDAQIDMIVVHSTGGPTCDSRTGQPVWVPAGELDANLRFIEAHPVLGIHYMIGRDGTLRASVPENQLAHHVMAYSQRSIAIELVNDGDGKDPFSAAQIDATIDLLRDIVKRRGIRRENVVRHSDLDRAMMPCDPKRRRKVDPGDAYPHERVLDAVFRR